jgi:hypothetical protein
MKKLGCGSNLSDEQAEQLESIAKRRQIAKSTLIRVALDHAQTGGNGPSPTSRGLSEIHIVLF